LAGDKVVELFDTILDCEPVTACTIRAYTDDIQRYPNHKEYVSYSLLALWVECSNETLHYGRITKRGPEELRTAFVQLVVGIKRNRQSASWRLMERYEAMKTVKGSGKSIIAMARNLSKIVLWFMLTWEEAFNVG